MTARVAQRLTTSASASTSIVKTTKSCVIVLFWSAQPAGNHIFTDSKGNKGTADENKLLSTTRGFTHEDLGDRRLDSSGELNYIFWFERT